MSENTETDKESRYRRENILNFLDAFRTTDVGKLAEEFRVEESVIDEDIRFLIGSGEPIRNKGNQVCVPEGWHAKRKYISHENTEHLKSILPQLSREDRKILRGIIAEFGWTEDRENYNRACDEYNRQHELPYPIL